MKHFAALIAGFAFSAATLHAQSTTSSVPESHRPPPGMCRIWIDGVPPTHQPAPTDCATAIRKRPLNARVVFGSEARGNDRSTTPAQPRSSSFTTPAVPSRDEQDRAAQLQLQQQRDEQERQRIAQQQREAQERRIEAQRQHEEQDKHPAPQSVPSAPPHTQERVTPPPRPHNDKPPQRPPQSSYSTRRPG